MASFQNMILGKDMWSTQGNSQAAVDSSPLLWVRYTGSGSGATIAVTSTVMSFTTDGSTPDTTIAGGTAGSITFANAAENTLGEMVDLINASENWEAYLLGDIRAESSANALVAVTAFDMSTSAKKSTGHFFYNDTSALFNVSFGISGFKVTGSAAEAYETDENIISCLTYLSATTSYGSGTSTIQVYSASQTGETLLFSTAGGSSGTAATLGTLGGAPFVKSKLGERLVVKVNNSAALTSPSVLVNGYAYDITGKRFVDGYTLSN